MKLILGSQSKTRQRILRDAGYEFEVMPSDFDEFSVRVSDPKVLAAALARGKSDALLARIIEPALVLTTDTIVECDGEILEKPADADEVRRWYKKYGEHPVRVHSATTVANTATGKRADGVASAAVRFEPVPADIVEQLISNPHIFSLGGAFTLAEPLIKDFVEYAESDYDTIEGLSIKLFERLQKEIT